MQENQTAGYLEIEHTADWELQVWAPDLCGLLVQAARGMYALSNTRLASGPRQARHFRLEFCPEPGPEEISPGPGPEVSPGLDPELGERESLLVRFLAELLFYAEMEGLAFDHFELRLLQGQLQARVTGAPIAAQAKEIKAVTYHCLQVRATDRGLQANIVFDV